MDGSRGATGSMDVGISHLNMNINVIRGGGHGLGVQGSSDTNSTAVAATGDAASASSPLVCEVAVNKKIGESSDRLGLARGQFLISTSSRVARTTVFSIFLFCSCPQVAD